MHVYIHSYTQTDRPRYVIIRRNRRNRCLRGRLKITRVTGPIYSFYGTAIKVSSSDTGRDGCRGRLLGCLADGWNNNDVAEWRGRCNGLWEWKKSMYCSYWLETRMSSTAALTMAETQCATDVKHVQITVKYIKIRWIKTLNNNWIIIFTVRFHM